MLRGANCFVSIFTFAFHFKEDKSGNCRRRLLGWFETEEQEGGHL